MGAALLNVTVNKSDGSPTTLADYKGKVLLIVNVASACGLTPQYAGLESIYEKYREQGLEVLGFPCNDFGAQEPGTQEEIHAFCTGTFGVQFPIFQKLSVKPDSRHPLYVELIEEQPTAEMLPGTDFRAKLAGYGIKPGAESDVLWNFEKFLVGRDGKVARRFSPDTPPDSSVVLEAIETELAKATAAG